MLATVARWNLWPRTAHLIVVDQWLSGRPTCEQLLHDPAILSAIDTGNASPPTSSTRIGGDSFACGSESTCAPLGCMQGVTSVFMSAGIE